MNISTRYIHIGTYETDYNGFYVDITLDTKDKTYESTLFHERYGIREDMFGEPANSMPVEEFIELVENNLDGYVEYYINARENEDGHKWKY